MSEDAFGHIRILRVDRLCGRKIVGFNQENGANHIAAFIEKRACHADTRTKIGRPGQVSRPGFGARFGASVGLVQAVQAEQGHLASPSDLPGRLSHSPPHLPMGPATDSLLPE